MFIGGEGASGVHSEGNSAWKADSNVKREMRESFGDRLLHHTEIVLIKGDKLPTRDRVET